MPSYLVTWVIDIEADDPVEAAAQAFAIMQRENTTATVFDVQHGDTILRIDLADHHPLTPEREG